MRTVRESLVAQRKYHERRARENADTLRAVEKCFPALLDFKAVSVYQTAGGGGVRLVASSWNKEMRKSFFGRAVETLEERLGTLEADVAKDVWGRTLKAEIPLEEEEGFVVLFSKSVDKKCQKIRVTQVLEVCGEVDESKYDSVEYIE